MFLLDLFWGMEGGLKLYVPFFLGGGGALLGDSKVEKWGDNQKKKFFINKSVEALSHKTAEIHFPDIYLIK